MTPDEEKHLRNQGLYALLPMPVEMKVTGIAVIVFCAGLVALGIVLCVYSKP